MLIQKEVLFVLFCHVMENIYVTLNKQPTVVINLSTKISNEALIWLIERISLDKARNGCELDVHQEEANLLFVSASSVRLLLGAEGIGLKKEYKDGTLREFSYADSHNFKGFNDDSFLMESECHEIIKYELDGLRSFRETSVPGHPKIHLQRGQSIFYVLRREKLIADCFPLHNRPALANLKNLWFKRDFSLLQPINAIQEYYGHTLAIYFAFVNYYTIGLIPLIVFFILNSIFGRIAGMMNDVLVAIIVTAWSTALLISWKRKSNEYLYKWGSFGSDNDLEFPRPQFYGELSINIISKRKEPKYASWKRFLRIWFISNPIIAGCICLSVMLMLQYFSWEMYFMDFYQGNNFFSLIMQNIPCILYSVAIIVADFLYRHLAEYLTLQENHKLESEFQNHLICKMLVFVFVNNFLVLFYIAFVYNDLPMLRMTLWSLFLMHIILSQIWEAIFPFWRFKARSFGYRYLLLSAKGLNYSSALGNVSLTKQEQAMMELQQDEYKGTFDDYTELWLQFGYVALFSSIYPSACFLAFMSNVIEERSDAFKMCCIYRRPFPISKGVVKVWQTAFEFLSYVAIASNLLLLFRSESFNILLRQIFPDITNEKIVVLFFICEHLLLFLRWFGVRMISDAPHWVNQELQKIKFWSLQAFKRQRSLVLRSSERFRILSQSAPV